MSYIDEYKEYLRGKTVLGDRPMDVDNMTEDELSTAMGYMLLKSQDTKTADRPFLPTQEEYDDFSVRLYNDRNTLKERFDIVYNGSKDHKTEAERLKKAVRFSGISFLPSAERDTANFVASLKDQNFTSKEDAMDFMVGILQNDIGYAGKERPEPFGYPTLYSGPKFTNRERELLIEKARLHSNPPEKPAWWKSALHSIGKAFGRDWFQKDFDAYDRLSKINDELTSAHESAEESFGQDRVKRELLKQREAKQKQQEAEQKHLNQKQQAKSLFEDPESSKQIADMINGLGQPQQNNIIEKPQEIKEQPQVQENQNQIKNIMNEEDSTLDLIPKEKPQEIKEQPKNKNIVNEESKLPSPEEMERYQKRLEYMQKIQEQPQEQPQENQKLLSSNEYLDSWLRSAETLRNLVGSEEPVGSELKWVPKEKSYQRVLALADSGAQGALAIKDYLNPNSKGQIPDKMLSEATRCLGMYQMFCKPLESGVVADTANILDENNYAALNNVHLSDLLAATRKMCPYGSETLSSGALMDRLAENKPIFSKEQGNSFIEKANEISAAKNKNEQKQVNNNLQQHKKKTQQNGNSMQ